jgi:hypothetical protein
VFVPLINTVSVLPTPWVKITTYLQSEPFLSIIIHNLLPKIVNNIVTYEGCAWLIITGSGLNSWIYWHFFTVTCNYNSSQSMTAWDSLHSLLDYECLLSCVTDLVLIYESVTSSASVVRCLTLHSWTLNSLTDDERRTTARSHKWTEQTLI